MEAIEPMARELGRSLLVLDTRLGDKAEHLYRKLRSTEVGIIPSYAQNAAGMLEATILFYKLLSFFGPGRATEFNHLHIRSGETNHLYRGTDCNSPVAERSQLACRDVR
jgi:hypothetical protein